MFNYNIHGGVGVYARGHDANGEQFLFSFFILLQILSFGVERVAATNQRKMLSRIIAERFLRDKSEIGMKSLRS